MKIVDHILLEKRTVKICVKFTFRPKRIVQIILVDFLIWTIFMKIVTFYNFPSVVCVRNNFGKIFFLTQNFDQTIWDNLVKNLDEKNFFGRLY